MRNYLNAIGLSWLLFLGGVGQSSAEKIVLEGPSCNYTAHHVETECSASKALLQQETDLPDDELVWSPSLLELEAFRLQNEAYRAGLERARQASEDRRLSAKVLFTPAYLREMAQYKKGMELYFLRNRKYLYIVERLSHKKPAIKTVKMTKQNLRKKTTGVRKLQNHASAMASDSHFPPFPKF